MCIKITPVKALLYKEKLFPPKMVSSLGTKSMSGDKGWKYVYDDGDKGIKIMVNTRIPHS